MGDCGCAKATGTADRSLTAEPPHCSRSRGISGRYGGTRAGGVGRVAYQLDLRLDVDARYNAHSPVMNRVSGDVYRVNAPSSGRTIAVYESSWIVDAPRVAWEDCRAIVTGTVRYFHDVHPPTTVTIVVPWNQGALGTATVTFALSGVDEPPYLVRYRSDSFRTLELEVDYATSVDIAPDAPSYDTSWHANVPADLGHRVLTIGEAYRECGVAVSMSGGRSTIDDGAAGFSSWSPSELHDAMETAYSRFASTWPNWRMWGLQAGKFDSAGVGGVMFDAAAAYGGSGKAPERQGFAVFRSHQWFKDLVAGSPANQVQARAMRQYLYTWVHEAGHAFNLLHSWDKARPSSLSWMNYDWKYDAINGADEFWANFRFRFDDEELLHIRHGDRASVIMGGDPWASGGHLEAPAAAFLDADPDLPVELLVRGKPYYGFMEPVDLEMRLRNTSTTLPVEVDARLDPSLGNTTIVIRRPDGTTTQYASIMCLLGEREPRLLAPAGVDGPDRYSEKVSLSYGTGGFLFDQPGQYQVRAIYVDGDVLAVSPICVIRVGHPAGREEDRFAADFFRTEVGLTMSLGGSMSPFLASGLDTLKEAAERFGGAVDAGVGAGAAMTVAASVGDDFYRRTEKDGLDVMAKHHSADPGEALSLTEPACHAHHAQGDKTTNLAYRELVELRARLHARNGQPAAATKELKTLGSDLAKRGVNPVVVAQISAEAASVASL